MALRRRTASLARLRPLHACTQPSTHTDAAYKRCPSPAAASGDSRDSSAPSGRRPSSTGLCTLLTLSKPLQPLRSKTDTQRKENLGALKKKVAHTSALRSASGNWYRSREQTHAVCCSAGDRYSNPDSLLSSTRDQRQCTDSLRLATSVLWMLLSVQGGGCGGRAPKTSRERRLSCTVEKGPRNSSPNSPFSKYLIVCHTPFLAELPRTFPAPPRAASLAGNPPPWLVHQDTTAWSASSTFKLRPSTQEKLKRNEIFQIILDLYSDIDHASSCCTLRILPVAPWSVDHLITTLSSVCTVV